MIPSEGSRASGEVSWPSQWGAPPGKTRLSPQQNGGNFGELGPAWTSPQPVRSVKVIGKGLGVY